MKSVLNSIAFVFIGILICFGQSESAIRYYDQKKYNEALQEWKQMMDAGAKGEDLYYNTANTYYRLQQYPEAILFYNKALKWNPNCEDCKKNLKLTMKAAGIESFELPEFILFKLYHAILLALQPMIWFVFGIVLLSIYLYFLFFKNANGISGINKRVLYLFVFFSAICFLMAFHRDQIKQNTDEVILMKSSFLYLSPDINSESKQTLIPGQVLQIKDHLSGWIKVQTKEFDLGWVEENKLEVVNL